MASKLLGAHVKRKEDPRLITGTSQYVGDVAMPGMQHVAFVRSPHAHARVRGIKAGAALKVPGVVAVVTGQDLRPHVSPIPVAQASAEGGEVSEVKVGRQHYPLSVDRVRYVGEPVAAVIGLSPEAAMDGVGAVEVDWEPLPAVADPFAAMADGAPQLFDDAPKNIEHSTTIKAGDPDAAFAKAHRVVKQRMNSQRLSGIPMETRAVMAAPDFASGGLTVWATHQAPHVLRGGLADALRMPQNQIRVIAPEVGGGFGVKFGTYPEDVTVAALARLRRVPLRWIESRVEHMTGTTHGRAQMTDLEAAVGADGRIAGLRMHVVADIGAYPIFTFIPDLTLMMGVGVYHVKDVELKNTCVFTNTTSVAAYRGAGRPEAAYYLERLVDCIATELGKPPEEIRRVNFIPPSAFPYAAPTGQNYDSGEYARALAKSLEVSKYTALRAEQRQRIEKQDRTLLGIGMACYVEMCGFGPYESAMIRVEPSGTVTAFTGASAHGQGHETTFAQLIADYLGVDFDQVVVRHGDTSSAPMGFGTGGSRSLVVGGSAIVKASEKVQERARRIAASMLEAAFEDIVVTDGRYHVKGAPAKSLALAQIAEKAYGEGLPPGMEPGLEATEYFRPPQLVYPFGAHVAVVEVDRDTGRIRLRDYVSVDDCGTRVSPTLVDGQVHGGIAQGVAQSMLEEVVYDRDGQLVTGSLMDYAIPRAEDLPFFVTDQTVTVSPFNPLGAKGIGEAATIGSTPALVNAVVDALKPFGVRHLDMPLRPERVWRAMQNGGHAAR
ncbi:MAG TPA: molybdopterin cofactor-binding domain-containing protein [Methylomirabilota bacterium]|jgi:aerobic carbon-monoxide dehydrogenase large subunit|nr:molybdopterin cofactor-binding domain-containing protein [Methylomirabilota bacterium]